MVKKVGKYELGKTLGEGTFGKVKYAIDTESNEAVAIKILDKEKIQKQNMGNQIKKEISIMKIVKHKNIVNMIEVLASKTKIFIVLELVTGGELFEKIVNVGKLQEKEAKFYFMQLIDSIEYCHKLGICHRDLKPENLLLDEHGNLKVSDFGLSSLYVGDPDDTTNSRTQILHTTCGTPNYVAPEVLSDHGYDGKKADIWSCGVILYVLVAGFLPFDENTIVNLFAKIQAADFTYPSWFSPELRDLLDKMLVVDPKNRITIAKMREHVWIKGDELTKEENEEIDDEVKKENLKNDELNDINQNIEKINLSEENQTEPAKDEIISEDEEQEDFSNGPKRLNAFDLVSHCGGFMIDKMFTPELFYQTEAKNISNHFSDGQNSELPESQSKSENASSTNSLTKKTSFNSSILVSNNSFSKQAQRKCFHYTSSVAPLDLTKIILEEIKKIGFVTETPDEFCLTSGLIKAELLTVKGMVGLTIQCYLLTDDVTLLEIKKGKGDIFEFNKAYEELVEKRLSHLINKPKNNEDAKDFQ